MSKEKVLNNLYEEIAVENCKKRYKKTYKINRALKNISLSIMGCLSITGIVFANDISAQIYDNFFLTGDGVATAINEGYIENTNMEAENSVATVADTTTGKQIDAADTSIKVDEFVMDDFTLSMTFDVTLSDKASEIIKAEDVYDMNFPDLIIYDENNTVLFCNSGIQFDEFCKEKNLGYNYDTATDEQYIGSGVNTFVSQKDGNHVKVVYNIYTGGDCSYPKSKKLNIEMSQIKIAKNEQTKAGDEEITLNGDWNFSVDVPEKMYNRQTTNYVQKKSSDDKFKVTAATVYPTGMNVTIQAQSEKIPERKVSEEWKFYKTLPDGDELKNSEILNYIAWKEEQMPENKAIEERVRYLYDIDSYVTNSNGEKFEMTQGPNANGSVYIDKDGIMTYKATYDLTNYNQTDEITVHISYHGEDIEIVLGKEQK